MEGRRQNSDHVERKIERIAHALGYIGIRGHAASAESLDPHMPADENEGDDAGPALQQPEPVGHPRMADGVGLPCPPYIEAVKSMEKNRQPDSQRFDDDAPGNSLQIAGGFVVFPDADERVAIGPEMLGEECANGDDSG